MKILGYEVWDTTPSWARTIIRQNELILAALKATAKDDRDIDSIYDAAQGIVEKDDEALKK